MRRRHVLGTLGALVGAAVGWRSAGGSPAGGIDHPAERLLGVLRRRESAAVVGRAYLDGHPAEARAGHLVETLERDLQHHHGRLGQPGAMELKPTLSALIRDDFAAGRVVTVEGWLLSRSEARLCGLAALA